MLTFDPNDIVKNLGKQLPPRPAPETLPESLPGTVFVAVDIDAKPLHEQPKAPTLG